MLRAIAAAKRGRTTGSMPARSPTACDAISCRSATWPPRRFGTGDGSCATAGLLVKQMVQMKNRVSGLLLEKGVTHTRQRLHKVGYFAELMAGSEEIDASIRPLLVLSCEHIVRTQKLDYALVSSLERDPMLVERSAAKNSSRGRPDHCADAPTGDRRCHALSTRSSRLSSLLRIVRSGEELSRQGDAHAHHKQRNKHIQHVLVEAAKLAPQTQCHELALLHEKGDAEGQSKPLPPWPWPGNWFAGSSRWNAENRTSCLPKTLQGTAAA